MVGLAISYALGITGKLSGLVTSFTGSFHFDTKERQQKNIITNTNRDGEGAGGRGARAAICEQDPARAGEVDGGDGVRDLFNITLKGIGPKADGEFQLVLQVEGTITSPYDWPSEGIVTLKNVKLRF